MLAFTSPNDTAMIIQENLSLLDEKVDRSSPSLATTTTVATSEDHDENDSSSPSNKFDLESLKIVEPDSPSLSPLTSASSSPVTTRLLARPLCSEGQDEEEENNDDEEECNDDTEKETGGASFSNLERPVDQDQSTQRARSVFSGYWKKTGQRPIPIRSMRAQPSFSSITEHSPESPGSNSESCSNSRSPKPISIDGQVRFRRVSTADLLEGNTDEERLAALEIPPSLLPGTNTHAHSEPRDELSTRESLSVSPQFPSRRRSILPVAPPPHPVLRSTRGSITSGPTSRLMVRKSISLPSVEASTPLRRITDKTRSLSLGSCGTASTPGASCLRPFQKYSCSPQRRNSMSNSSNHGSADGALGLPPSSSSSCGPNPPSSDSLCRQNSNSSLASATSSVSFLDAVDVLHFETPQEIFAEKGWSDYFK